MGPFRSATMRWLALASVIGLARVVAVAEPLSLPKVRYAYAVSSYGELHYAIARPSGTRGKTPLILLHQAMNSSVKFGNLVPEMGRDRVTIASDTPGYGGSAGRTCPPQLKVMPTRWQ